MKILLVGASSDIAQNLYNNHKNNYNFIRLSSDCEHSDVDNFNLQDSTTYVDEDNIDGIVYFPSFLVNIWC